MVSRETAQKILEACQNEKAWFINLLEELVTIETPPHKPKKHRKLFERLIPELEELNFRTAIYPGPQSGGQLFARKPDTPSKKYQLLLGHIDTVWPEGTLQEMPFKQNSDTIAGPGVYDMKAGITMMVTALKVLQQNELCPSVQPVLFINSDEETGSKDSKRRIQLLAQTMERVFVLEPSLDEEGKIKTQRKGIAHFKVQVTGKSAHAGLKPEEGRSAILELSHLVQKLFELNDPERGITVNVGKIDGGISTNVVAPQSSADVDVRVLGKKDARRIEKQIKSLTPSTPDVSVKITGGFGRPPMVRNKRNRKLWKIVTECGSLLDIHLEEGISGGASDGNLTSQLTATIDGLGAVGEGAHSSNEKIYLEETIKRTALLALLLLAPELEDDN